MVFVQRRFGGFFLLLMAALLGAVAWWTYVGAARDATDAGTAFARLAANQAARMVEAADLLLIDMQRIARVADWNSPDVVALAQGELELLAARSEEHTSELQSLMRISYAVFCLKKKNTQ